MKKTIVLLTLIFVFFSIAEVKAESYYLYCHNRTFMGDPAYSRIDITGFQDNGLILLRFNKYGPSIGPEDAYFSLYDYTPAFGVFSYPYLYIFSSKISHCTPGTANNCIYSATILTLEYGTWWKQDGLFGESHTNSFILRETWATNYSLLPAMGGIALNTWYRQVPNNQLIYDIGYEK